MSHGELFIQPAYLDALHGSGSASPESGWQHLPELAPMAYLKSHSWGEFVFDFEIANAYRQVGMEYYPRLVLAVPFTPVSGPRLCGLTAPALEQAVAEHEASSAHVLFAQTEDIEALTQAGWLARQDLRYVWRDRGFVDFEGFLSALASKKRKNIRAERRSVAALGLDIRWQDAGEFSAEEWQQLYRLYTHTYAVRGQAAYLEASCLRAWARDLAEQFVFCVARRNGELVAMAFFFRDHDTLYGRHWGSSLAADKLHFELCYYQGIEYCLDQGLTTFDAGVQGSHRILRGFEAELSRSAHWFADARFQRALARAFEQERTEIERYLEQARSHSAYAR